LRGAVEVVIEVSPSSGPSSGPVGIITPDRPTFVPGPTFDPTGSL
jgi:hypothetical protein